MSTALPSINLSSAIVGSTGTLDLSKIMGGGGINTTPGAKLPTIRLHNDSGSGLQITLPHSGQSFYLPAGGWVDCNPAAGETQITYTVLYILPDPPVTLLMATYYAPSELVPPMTILGNSPVGIGGTVNTNVTSTQSIVNTTNAPLSNWLNVQPTDATSATFTGDTSGNLTVKGDNAGVLTTLLQLIAGASPGVKLAAAAVLTEVLGTLQVDGTSTFTGAVTANNASNSIKASSVPASGVTSGALPSGVTIGGSQVTSAVATANGVSLPNNTPIYWTPAAGGGGLGLLYLDSSDILEVLLSPVGDRFIMRDSSGTEYYLDFQSGGMFIGDSTTKLPVTIYGAVTCNSDLTVDGSIFGTGGVLAIANEMKMNGSAPQITNASGTLQLDAASGGTFAVSIGGVGQLTLTTGNLHVDNHGVVCANVQPTAGQLNRIKFGHVAALSNQTVTHGMGATPSAVFISADINQPGSSNTGAGSVGSTTFVASSAAGNGFWWLALG